jgi:lactoylglutathione lyase
MKFNLIVLKSRDIDATMKFYEFLGLHFTEEKHVDGPRHYSSVIDDVVLEIYPARQQTKAQL